MTAKAKELKRTALGMPEIPKMSAVDQEACLVMPSMTAILE
jgi:hypothetical protein